MLFALHYNWILDCDFETRVLGGQDNRGCGGRELHSVFFFIGRWARVSSGKTFLGGLWALLGKILAFARCFGRWCHWSPPQGWFLFFLLGKWVWFCTLVYPELVLGLVGQVAYAQPSFQLTQVLPQCDILRRRGWGERENVITDTCGTYAWTKVTWLHLCTTCFHLI